MKIELYLDEEDYLTYQLYTASTSERIKKKRKKSWIFTTIFFASLAFLFYVAMIHFLAVYFVIASVITLVLYPLYSRRKYKNYYKKYIQENYQEVIGKRSEMEFYQDFISGRNETGESKIYTTDVKAIIEISTHFFIKLKSGPSIIINKAQVTDIGEMIVYLQQLSKNLSIEISQELSWTWK
ncbi:MAG: hypothetical protein AAF655_04160 [Bacteroidota bacterium]